VSQIFEKKCNSIKNYGIVFKYLTRTGAINMYKEFRDITLTGAVSQMYQEMSGRHSARHDTIRIIKTSVLADSQLRRNQTIQWTRRDVRFPKLNNTARAPHASMSGTFKANRPTLI